MHRITPRNIVPSLALSLLLAAIVARPEPLHAQGKAHVHGAATLDIGIQGRSGTVEFRAPADDLYGFEREPRTPAERAKRDSAFARLRTQPLTLVRFDASLGCTMTARDVGVVEEQGGHGDVRARYDLACRVAPAGKPIAFGFSRAFRGVRSVKVQLLSDTAQVGFTVVNDRGTVRP
jgi:hypothetical protein